MPFTKKAHAFKAAINEVTLGTGDKAVTFGGANTFPFYSFDAEAKHKPIIGAEISDMGYEEETEGYKAFYGTADVVERAKKAAAMDEVAFICLHFAAADPFGANKSTEDCIAEAKAVAEAIDKPIVVMGCKNIDKDTEKDIKDIIKFVGIIALVVGGAGAGNVLDLPLDDEKED